MGENVSNPFMAFTKISIIIKVKLVNALSSASTEDLPQLCDLWQVIPSHGFFSFIHCMVALKLMESHFPFGVKDL